MKMRCLNIAFLFSYILICNACTSLGFGSDPKFPYDQSRIREVMDSVAKADTTWMYADTYSKRLYNQQIDSVVLQDTLYWINPEGVDERAEVLVNRLKDVERHGLKRSSFYLDEIEADLSAFRALKPDSCTQEEVCQLLGKLEYRLTSAYFRYTFGQRFGYTRAYRVFHNINGSSGGDTQSKLFDYKMDIPTDSFFSVAINKMADEDDMNSFLDEVQPSDSLYYAMCREYQNAVQNDSNERAEVARINVERARWRYARPPKKGRHIWVNLPSYMLRAVNTSKKEELTMKICCGKKDHQTPLLNSNISRLELNPYWVVPTSIVKKEIAPGHTGDANYFARNNMVAIDNQTKEELSAASLSRAQLLSGRYTIRQEKGAGNSLGRLIFRFPNRFAVYLHDTNTPSAFKRISRAVSHGCVRVEKPLDLALFLMDNPDELLIDKIRVAIDLKPLSDKGKKYKEETDPEDFMKNYMFKPTVPVFIDYYTLYPESNGTMVRYPDIYGYDKALKKVLDQF
ncbi:MAG: L,D-transpeptidase family protein [Bacteroidaceae bacterium]|nr:L,D-transpeptidase family protein [Bacteroidaceae bacterium]